MDKLCLNCDTENPADAVICSECGMSLISAARNEAAPPTTPPAQDTTDRKVKAMRHNERPLALFWALLASVIVGLAIVWLLYNGWAGDAPLSVLALLVLLAWVSWAIASRREGVAATLLALQSFIIIGIAFIAIRHQLVELSMLSEREKWGIGPGVAEIFTLVYSVVICIGGILMASLPSLLAIRFARIWRKSRTPGTPKSSPRSLKR